MTQEPSKDPSPNTSALIKQAAQKLLLEGGLGAVSVRRVAKEAGVGMGTLRYHFPSREALLEACLGDYHAQLLALQVEEIAAIVNSENPEKTTLSAVERVFDFVSANSNMQRLAELTTLKEGEVPPVRSDRLRDPFLQEFSALLAERVPHTQEDLRLAIASVMRLVTWYGSRSEEELVRLTGAPSAEDAHRATRSHLVAISRRLVFSA